MGESYYDNIFLNEEIEEVEAKLTKTELQELKSQIENEGFILQYNNDERDLRERELCIKGEYIKWKVKGKIESVKPAEWGKVRGVKLDIPNLIIGGF